MIVLRFKMFLSLFACGVILSACGDEDENEASQSMCELCDWGAACGDDAGPCRSGCNAVLVSPACITLYEETSCDSEYGASLATSAACFPACETESASCDGNQLTVCTGLRTMVLICEGVCKAQGGTYSGTCGSSYDGRQSQTGRDVCWCDDVPPDPVYEDS